MKSTAMQEASSMEVPVQAAYECLCQDRTVTAAVWRIPMPVLYFCSFVAMLFAHIPASSMYAQGNAVSSTLATSGSDTITSASTLKFYNIGETADVFEWLTDTFVPSVFVTQDYNGHELTKDRWGRVAKFNKVLGAVNFQVTKMAMHNCSTHPFLARLYPYCYDPTNTTVENRLISFDTNATEAAAMVAGLKKRGDWLDYSAEELLITIVTYNGELQGYAVTEMQLAFDAGGSVQMSSSTTPALSNPYQADITAGADIVVAIFFVHALSVQLRRIYRLRRTGLRNLVCGDVWVVIEHASTVAVGVFYVFWMSIVGLMFKKDFRDNLASLVVSGKNWTNDVDARGRLTAVTAMLKDVAKLTIALRLIATLAVFLLGLRILKRFRFHPRLSILTRTVASALHQFRSFFVVFVVIFVTFAVSGTILFGDRVAEFSSLQTAMETCINMLFGNFDYDSIQGLYEPVSMFYYWGYMIVVSLVLLNMMLAIVLDAYAEVSSASNSPYNMDVSRIASNLWWDLTLRVHDVVRGKNKELSAKTAPQIAQKGELLGYKELSHSAVVFRGRIRPRLLERVLCLMLQQEGNAKPATVTARMLVETFFVARIQPAEAHATIQHIMEGIVEATSDDGTCETLEPTPKTLTPPGNDERNGVVHPAPSEEGPRIDDILPSISPATTTESSELQRMAAQLAALEQKLDLLLKSSGN